MATAIHPTAAPVNGAGPTPTVVFEPFDLPAGNQRLLGAPHPPGTVSPLALRPSQSEGGGESEISLDAAIAAVRELQARDQVLTRQLARHGTLLFRGLPIHDADEFSRFAHAFGYRPHEIIGIVVDRPLLAPNVAPANEAPPAVQIYNHNESPQVPHAPEYVFFYGHKTPAPGRGGETPIASSLELFARAQAELPELVRDLAAKGLRSSVTYRAEAQYAGGSTLRQAFGKTVEDGDDRATRRAKIEAQIARYGRGPHTTWTWLESADGADDDGIVLTHHLPVIRTQPGTNLPSLFTGLAAYYRNAQRQKTAASSDAADAAAARSKAAQQTYGDGTPIPDAYLQRLAEITDEIRVLHRWQPGDVLVYDNIIAQHGREPWLGEKADRVVLASLFDAQVPGAYTDADWAQVVQASA